MDEYMIITDSTADLPEEYLNEHNVGCMYLNCIMKGITYNADNKIDSSEFYKGVRSGEMPTTSQVNPAQARKEISKYINDYKKILCICLSSGISGTFQSVSIAAEELMEEHSDVRIEVIDSLSASLGEGLLVHKAVKMRESGDDFDTTVAWCRENNKNIIHMFTVDDLGHLARGGRISKSTALVGSMVGIKPLLFFDNEGHLVNIGKCRGRKKSLNELVEGLDKRMGQRKSENDIFFIGHGDCIEDAEYVADLLREKYGTDSFLINYISPVIGAHSGPGTVALFGIGDGRD